MGPDCIQCRAELELLAEGGECYTWRCTNGCSPDLDTGVPLEADISAFQRYAIRKGEFQFSSVVRSLPEALVPGAKVYMPQILYHFIECTWGGCYNSIYQNCIVPYLDCPAVVDYVLRSPVIDSSSDLMPGETGARIYGDLFHRLRGVSSPRIADYLNQTFLPN